MAREQSLQEWARTATVPHPPDWGEIEADLLSRSPRPATGRAHAAIYVVLFGMAALVYGGSVIGLAIVATNAQPGEEMSPLASYGARFAFFAALGVLIATLSAWRTTRRRQVADLVVAGGTAAASLTTYLIVRPASEPWVGLLALAAGGFGLILFVIILIASKPGRRARLPFPVRLRTVLSPPNEAHYRQAREQGLQLLIERNAVQLEDEARQKLIRMPLGSWHTYDSSVPQSGNFRADRGRMHGEGSR